MEEISSIRVTVRGRETLVLASQVRIYARKSVQRERAERSIEDQVRDCARACRRLGLPVAEADVIREKLGLGGDHFWDRGIPDLDPDGTPKKPRPGLTRLVEEIRQGLVKVVVVYDHSRLWRSTGVCNELMGEMWPRGVLLLDAEGEFAPIESADGRQVVNVQAAAAQHYREKTIQLVARRFRNKRSVGEAVNTTPVLGFTRGADGVVSPHPEGLALARRMFTMYAFGEEGGAPMTIDEVAQLLNQGDTSLFPRSTRKVLEGDGRWVYASSIGGLLRNPKYIAKQVDPADGRLYDANEFLVDGKPAIDDALWQETQRRLRANASVPRSWVKSHPFSGLLRCGVCASPFARFKNDDQKTPHPAYRIRINNDYHQCRDYPPAIHIEALDAYLQSHLAPLLLMEIRQRSSVRDRRVIENRIAEAQNDREERRRRYEGALQGALAELEHKNPKLMADIFEQAEASLSELDARVASLRAELRLVDLEAERLADLGGLSDESLRATVRSVLRWAAVVPGEREGGRNNCAVRQGKVLFLTAWGTYHTAVLERGRRPNQDLRARTNHMRPAEPHEMLGSVLNLPDPDRFVANLRRELVNFRHLPFTPSEWAPGYSEEGLGVGRRTFG